MAVLSTERTRAGLGLGLVALGSSAAIFLLRRRLKHGCDESTTECEGAGEDPAGEDPATQNVTHVKGQQEMDAHSVKSRIGNFKLSKLRRLVEGIGEECGADVDFDWSSGTAVVSWGADRESSHVVATEETEAEQNERERKIFEEAVRVVQALRKSTVPRKLPHYHVLDKQLANAENLLGEIGDNVDQFWRYGRDEPMAALLELPFMRLAAEGGGAALLPLPLVPIGAGRGKAPQPIGPDPEDLALLDLTANADENSSPSRTEMEAAFRRRARELHHRGTCVNPEAYHELQEAYERCLQGRPRPPKASMVSSDDVLAHYLLVGTDAAKSRYREYAQGLLDVVQRERLLNRIDVLRNWGETSGSTTGLGQG